MIRRQPWIQLLLLAATISSSSLAAALQPEKAESKVPVDASAIVESLLCVVRSNPWQCIRQQASRMLDNWEDILEIKKHEMMNEADKEALQRAENRGLTGDGKKPLKVIPSNLINQIENGLGTITDFVSEGVDGVATSKKQKSDDEVARPKKHLHHILKLGNTGTNGTNGLARSAVGFDDELTDGLVDYGFDDGPEKAYGRGKQVGGPDSGYGVESSHDLGATGKRKGKKRKTYIKLFMLGAALKGKIELLLKILSFHLQLKFFAIAAIGLLINIARFWFDIKKQPQPQKVIYYEHAQHQHHYDDHGDEWNGGYWKRSLHGLRDDDNGYYSQDRNDRLEDEYPHHRPVQYAPVPNSPNHYPYDPHNLAYHQQRPYA
ncbi:uncharacterized protein LOC129724189 isoform X2 [Wyeomyia smithii]|uniref:uncharacterized protein LOC129724189 isoform X2 n=1 Tax=Wyeomyia smithii TaxID=174621 RepID=UPI002468100E|nr:uncharacterized protein LOC129724189 isoform X2 [Wyeomyia smithii]